MKKDEIVSVLMELNRITGFRVSLHDADYSEIAAFPKEKSDFCREIQTSRDELNKCILCDKSACAKALKNKDTYVYKCRHGITEAISPLYNFGTLTGFLMMGQVRDQGSRDRMCFDSTPDPEQLNRLKGYYDSLPEIRTDMKSSYINIMTICARYLTLSNAIPNEKASIPAMAKKYINDNYSKKLSIKQICNNIGCSKSTLMTSFKNEYGITVNDYILEVRLTESEKMIRSTTMSIGEIAINAGFSDQSYFSKVFSAKIGITPKEYRSTNEEATEK